MQKVWRDFSIIISAVWINLAVFILLLVLSAILMKVASGTLDVGLPQLILNAFHMSIMERVDTNNQLSLIILSFALPLASTIILGEGILRIVPTYLQRRENRKEWDLMVIKTFSMHTVVCGVGEMGKALVKRIISDNPTIQMVLIDPHPGILAEMGLASQNTTFLQADMTDVETLKKAGVQKANLVIFASGDDSHNLEAAYKVLRINPDIEIWVRLHYSGLADLLDLSRKPNIHFFCPYQQAADSIANQLLKK